MPPRRYGPIRLRLALQERFTTPLLLSPPPSFINLPLTYIISKLLFPLFHRLLLPRLSQAPVSLLFLTLLSPRLLPLLPLYPLIIPSLTVLSTILFFSLFFPLFLSFYPCHSPPHIFFPPLFLPSLSSPLSILLSFLSPFLLYPFLPLILFIPLPLFPSSFSPPFFLPSPPDNPFYPPFLFALSTFLTYAITPFSSLFFQLSSTPSPYSFHSSSSPSQLPHLPLLPPFFHSSPPPHSLSSSPHPRLLPLSPSSPLLPPPPPLQLRPMYLPQFLLTPFPFPPLLTFLRLLSPLLLSLLTYPSLQVPLFTLLPTPRYPKFLYIHPPDLTTPVPPPSFPSNPPRIRRAASA